MLEKFTEKGLKIVENAKSYAELNGYDKIYPEHILIGFLTQKCFVTKLLSMSKVDFEALTEKLEFELSKKSLKKSNTSTKNIGFAASTKIILKESFDMAKSTNSPSITTEHLFLAILQNKISSFDRILKNLSFDTEKATHILNQLIEKKILKMEHPEGIHRKIYESTEYSKVLSIFEDEESRSIFDHAVAKLTASNYEILGTEQIVQSILENNTPEAQELLKTLSDNGINADTYAQKSAEITSRKAEFEEKQIIFTPNAFKVVLLAIETAKELGEATVRPEHIILSILKAKSGIAYNIFKDLKIKDDELAHKIIKPIEKQMPETLTILRLAKNEARRLGRNIVGSELILLGIIAQSAGIGAIVLSELGITITQARKEVEQLLDFGDDYEATEIAFSEHAKLILENAAKISKQKGMEKIASENLLLAIINEPNCLAMKLLGNLGVDSVEIKQGILKEQKNVETI